MVSATICPLLPRLVEVCFSSLYGIMVSATSGRDASHRYAGSFSSLYGIMVSATLADPLVYARRLRFSSLYGIMVSATAMATRMI